MGCFSCSNLTNINNKKSEEILNTPLNYNLPFPSICIDISHNNYNQDLKNKIIRAKEILKEIEIIRGNLVLKFNKLLLESEAYIFKEKSTALLLRHLIYTLIYEKKGDLSYYGIFYIDDPPFIYSDNLNDIPIYNKITNYINSLVYLRTTLKQFENYEPELFFILNEINSNKIYSNQDMKILDKIETEVKICVELLPILRRFIVHNLYSFKKEMISYASNREYYSSNIIKLIKENNNLFLEKGMYDSFVELKKNNQKELELIILENNKEDSKNQIEKIIQINSDTNKI